MAVVMSVAIAGLLFIGFLSSFSKFNVYKRKEMNNFSAVPLQRDF